MREAHQRHNSNLGSDHGIQMVRRYPPQPGRHGRHFHESHIEPNLPDFHPPWTNLSLEWTTTGEWIPVPKFSDHVGSEPRNYKVARREKYIDEEGKLKEAISYGLDENSLTVWYDLEALRSSPDGNCQQDLCGRTPAPGSRA